MGKNFNRLRKNRDAVIKGTALFLLDIILIACSMVGALWLRFDFGLLNIEPVFWQSVVEYMPINIVCTVIINFIFRLYTSLWRFASVVELKNTVCAVILSSLAQFAGMKILDLPVPRSYIFIYIMLLAGCIIIPRFAYRFIRIMWSNYRTAAKINPKVTMVVGAGAAGYTIIREIKNSKHLNAVVPCIIDDDAQKQGTYLQGIPIVGKKEDIPEIAKKIRH